MEFDKNWLEKMGKSTSPRYSNHTTEKHRTYVGYWNFEAAAVTVMMTIDDAGLAKSLTYPKNWADWTRAQT